MVRVRSSKGKGRGRGARGEAKTEQDLRPEREAGARDEPRREQRQEPRGREEDITMANGKEDSTSSEFPLSFYTSLVMSLACSVQTGPTMLRADSP
jgi:hypothetical protein